MPTHPERRGRRGHRAGAGCTPRRRASTSSISTARSWAPACSLRVGRPMPIGSATRRHDVTALLSDRARTCWAPSWLTGGGAGTSRGRCCETSTATGMACWLSSRSPIPTDRPRPSGPGRTGSRPTDRSAAPISTTAKPLMPDSLWTVGTVPDSTTLRWGTTEVFGPKVGRLVSPMAPPVRRTMERAVERRHRHTIGEDRPRFRPEPGGPGAIRRRRPGRRDDHSPPRRGDGARGTRGSAAPQRQGDR